MFKTDQHDYCAKPAVQQLQYNNTTGSGIVDSINSVIDCIFNPLDSGNAVYTSSGYGPGYLINTGGTLSYEVEYDLINLEPDNVYDIYYRDPDKWMWDKNRKVNTKEVARNIQKIHDTIVVPLREKIKEMFNDKAFIFVEHCFMCRDALIKHKLDQEHLFSKAKAVLLRVEGEESSTVIYDEIVRWTSDDEDKYDGIDEEETIEPIEYGLMKLCNPDKEKKLIYITLPFTQEEIDNDELISKNKSNLTYTDSNDMMIVPDASTSTKIFPSYKNDNGVEDEFNELDDMEDELNELNDLIEQAKNDNDKALLEQLQSEKFEKEQEKDNLVNPNFDMSELDYNKKKAEELYEKFPTEENKKKIELATNELNKFPSFDDTLTVAVGKINSITVTIRSSLDISDQYQDYFNARKLMKLYVAIKCREAMSFDISEEELEEIYQYRIEAYNTEFKRRYDIKFKEKQKELYPDEVDENTELPPIEIDKDTIDMSDYPYPTKEEIRKEKEKDFNSLTEELTRIYDETDIEALDAIITDFPLNLVKFTEEEFIDVEKTEYKKFESLSELVKECDNQKKMLSDKKIYEEYDSIQKFIKDNNITENIKWLLDDKNDYNEVRSFYYDLVKSANPNVEDIDNKINLSTKLNDIFQKNNFNATIMPSNDTKEYADYIMKYLDSEIELYIELNDTEKLDKLNELKPKYEEYINAKEYSKLKLSDFQTSIYKFTDSEYYSARMKTFINKYEDKSNSNDERLLAYIAYSVLMDKSSILNESYFTNLNELGKKSFNLQVISNILDPIYKDTNNWLETTGLEIKSIGNKLKEDIKKLDEFIASKVNIFHNYLESFNHYMINILYNPDMNVRINKVYKANKRVYSFIDYGFEYITLQKQIGDSMNAEDSEAPYRVRLKQDRLMMKRQLVYVRLEEVDKKISNYELESVATVDFGKLNRFKTIQNEIIPELKRLKKLKEEFEPEDNESIRYEKMKEAEYNRLKFLYTLNVTDKSILYRMVTHNITMDYENERGMFANLNKTKDEKYIMYLEEVIKAIEKENNSAILNEIPIIQKEIDYIKNNNNEKQNKKAELIAELQQRKLDIQAELNKRKTDKIYLHNNVRVLAMESELKMKYKKFIKIEYLPSTGVTFKFPFMLYDEFKAKYKDVLNLPTEISEYEILDGYYRYSQIHYNVFNKSSTNYIKDFHSYWENIAYNPSISTMTEDIKKYIILVDEGLNKSFSKYISRSIYCIAGFIELDTILLTDNEDLYTSGIMVKMRRTIDFKEDLEYFLFNMFKQDKKIIESIQVKELDS